MNSIPDTHEVLCCPSALLPVGMSLTALLIVLLHVAFFGSAGAPDQGAAAHVWQFLLLAQVPALIFFLTKWLRRARRPTLNVLALQGLAIVLCVAAAAAAPVYFLNL